MGRLIITLLFSKDTNTEPPCILKCDTSGEYLPYYFMSWKDSIHYLSWAQFTNKEPRKDLTHTLWKQLFCNDDDEFTGDYNQFRPQGLLFVSNGYIIDTTDDLNKISVWNKN